MIDRGNFVDTTLKKLASLAAGQSLDIRSFKRNRKVVIVKNAATFTVIEDGFAKETFADLTEEALAKLLPAVEKREFPRSHKLRFYVLGQGEDSANRANYRIDSANIVATDDDPTFLVRLNCDYSRHDQLRHVIQSGGGVIEQTDYAHDVNLTVRLEAPLCQQLEALLWVSVHR